MYMSAICCDPICMAGGPQKQIRQSEGQRVRRLVYYVQITAATINNNPEDCREDDATRHLQWVVAPPHLIDFNRAPQGPCC